MLSRSTPTLSLDQKKPPKRGGIRSSEAAVQHPDTSKDAFQRVNSASAVTSGGFLGLSASSGGYPGRISPAVCNRTGPNGSSHLNAKREDST
jgi:hypothetical protein